MTSNLDLALAASGQRYLNLELDLRHEERGEPARSQAFRDAATSHTDPIGRLLAQVVLDWGGSRTEDYKAALAFLDYIPLRFKRTALGFPRPSGVEWYLTEHFANRVVELLALRLVQDAGWPNWKVVGIISYLETHKKPSTTAALIRFAIETKQDEWRQFALEAIRAFNDPDLQEKVMFEIARARKHGLTVPRTVSELVD